MVVKYGKIDGFSVTAKLVDPEVFSDEALLKKALEFEAFSGEAGQVCAIHDYALGNTVILSGLGKGGSKDCEKIRRAAAKAVEYAAGKKKTVLGFDLNGFSYDAVRSASEACVMAPYKYNAYLTSPKLCTLAEITVETCSENSKAAEEGCILGNAVCVARDLVNEPSNVQSPEVLAAEAVELGKKYGFEVEVLHLEQLKALGMKALVAVGQGSPNPPCLIVMRHKGNPSESRTLGLVGKGVTYDSGGLNLKSGQRFITMKHDMAGGGTVIGTICAAAALKLPVNITAVVPAVENLISAEAYRPGDIIGSMGGKTIQINSTDAEGRLALIDAITYSVEKEKVSGIIDIGTLTGAARRILGEFGAPVLGNDDALWDALYAASKVSGELICRVPLVEDARAKMRGDVSDLVNTSLAETGGMVTASLFLEEFVQGTPWMHIDAAGPLWLDKDMPYTPKGGSGWGVRTLLHAASEYFK